MRWALDAAKSAPDVRAGKVADVKRRIAQGTYTIDFEVVARRMLGALA